MDGRAFLSALDPEVLTFKDDDGNATDSLLVRVPYMYTTEKVKKRRQKGTDGVRGRLYVTT